VCVCVCSLSYPACKAHAWYYTVICGQSGYTIIIIFNYALQPFKAYCATWVRRSNFRHQTSIRVSPHESTQRRKMELWARNVREFCLNADFHVTFRDLLHVVKLRHGTDNFTSPPKEGVLRLHHSFPHYFINGTILRKKNYRT
jgi:hypothetical protein